MFPIDEENIEFVEIGSILIELLRDSLLEISNADHLLRVHVTDIPELVSRYELRRMEYFLDHISGVV